MIYKKITILIFTLNLIGLANVKSQCKCFNGIDSSPEDEPVLIVDLGNGNQVSVCGYDETKYSATKIKMSSFNVFQCNNGNSLIEFGKNQTCVVQKTKNYLSITEEAYLPIGENWKWKFIPLSRLYIKLKSNKINLSKKEPVYQKPNISQDQIDSFLKEIENYRNGKIIEEWENVIGKLLVLVMVGNEKAYNVLSNFNSFFNYEPDELIAPIYNDALAKVQWIRSSTK